ncbi:translation factor waclaw isoform X2 [Lycorma delicatula]|uniref:translation factor waclaw isoform X2 n=1 Tax=Lycorma delicatula TaxID=130591 RepID=UPI003F510A16
MICHPNRMKIDKLLFAVFAYKQRSHILSNSYRDSVIDRITNFKLCMLSKRCFASKEGDGGKKKGSVERVNVNFKMIPDNCIRNFSIIAHVDHGKSTLADRLLEMTGTLKITPGENQVLDRLQVERERGITVKAQTASLLYTYKGKEYLLNLIDTPGHVDFSNEVIRSLVACQGVLLLVDANQGVQAQTVANFYLAFTKELVIVPVLNKVDLKYADPEGTAKQLNNLFGIEEKDVLKISAKLGTGVEEVLNSVIERIPPPNTDRNAPLKAVIFDSWYDRYKGAITLVYIKDGRVKSGDVVVSAYSKNEYTVRSVGILRPHEELTDELLGGQVGFIICNMRSTKEAYIGDTLYLKSQPVDALEPFKPAKPMVFAGVYPMDQSEFPAVRAAIDKLTLNDPAVTVVNDASPALGQGWRLGFLGLLHMEVFNQRLEQEHNAHAIIAAPSVPYKVTIVGKKNIEKYGGEVVSISNPAHWPDVSIIKEIMEPIVLGTIITPDKYVGRIIQLCIEKRGIQKNIINIDKNRIMIQFLLPLNEIIVDFHDSLKSATSGFASFDYEDHDYVPSKLVKMNILLNGTPVEELSTIIHSSKVQATGRRLCQKLVEIIPRQQYQYGGDVTRKMKLLKKQAEGKRRMKLVANIQIPRETFIEVLKR